MSREHMPPQGMVLRPGVHTWQCPDCLEETVFEADYLTCSIVKPQNVKGTRNN